MTSDEAAGCKRASNPWKLPARLLVSSIVRQRRALGKTGEVLSAAPGRKRLRRHWRTKLARTERRARRRASTRRNPVGRRCRCVGYLENDAPGKPRSATPARDSEPACLWPEEPRRLARLDAIIAQRPSWPEIKMLQG